jgi:hypothetical protein
LEKKTKDLNKEAETLTKIAKDIETKSTTIEDIIEERRVKLDNFIHNNKSLQEFEDKHKEKKEKIK